MITPMMRNITAIAMKKFLIWKAIAVNEPMIPSDPPSPGAKKNHLSGPVKSSRRVLLFPVSDIRTSLTLLSILPAAEVTAMLKKMEIKKRRMRIVIYMKK